MPWNFFRVHMHHDGKSLSRERILNLPLVTDLLIKTVICLWVLEFNCINVLMKCINEAISGTARYVNQAVPICTQDAFCFSMHQFELRSVLCRQVLKPI